MTKPKNLPLTKKIIGAVLGIIILIVCVIFSAQFFNLYINIALGCAIVIVSILFTISIVKSIQGLYKLSILIVYFGAIILALVDIVISTGVLDILLNAEDGEQLYSVLNEQFGNNLYIALIVIQFLQVTFIPIASSIVTAAGYYLCGQNVLLTILFCCIGLWLGSLFAFFLGRIFGVKLVKWVAGEKILLKYNNLVKGKDKVMLGYMFMFPIYPDDVLCLIAGLTTMSWREFIFLQLISRPINVAITVLMLHFGTSLTTLFPLNTVWGILFWIVAIGLFVVTFILVWKKADKLEVIMNKLISKITGRPILTDINTIYKLSTAKPETIADTNENIENEILATTIEPEEINEVSTTENIQTENEEEQEIKLVENARITVDEILSQDLDIKF